MFKAPTPTGQELVVTFLDAVAKAGRAGASLKPDQWEDKACGTWSAADLARHLLSQTRHLQHQLDRAISGDSEPSFDTESQHYQNRIGVEFLAHVNGPAALADFVATAGRYANRIANDWELTVGHPDGKVNAYEHCALAALELHLHAWDLALLSGTAQEPPRVKELLAAVSQAQATQSRSKKRLRNSVTARARQRYRAWDYLLESSGRLTAAETPPQPEEIIDLRDSSGSDAELSLPGADVGEGVSSN